MTSSPFFLTDPTATAIPIHAVTEDGWQSWLDGRAEVERNWLAANGFKPGRGRSAVVPGTDGAIAAIVLGLGKDASLADPHLWGGLANSVPKGNYEIATPLDANAAHMAALGWALGRYKFDRYKSNDDGERRLKIPDGTTQDETRAAVRAHFLVRDLINTPANDMGPADLAAAAKKVADEMGAQFTEIVGDDLLEKNLPAIHTVGRASVVPPRLIDIRWGDAAHPRVTLVGKGVCFDTGGLNIKPGNSMRLMKKDMGGGAHALGLAYWVMASKLPVQLRLLIPAVENSIAGNAYRPGDVMATRKGLTVEIDNTDAEGRNILCDALALADEETPDLLIDFATLTGAARVALGTDLPALFTPDQKLADDFLRHGEEQTDQLWQLPLWAPYDDLLESRIADICHASSGGFGGAITAALFLQHFVENTKAWAHIDLYAWNTKPRPGRPEGGAAMSLRAAYALIAERAAPPSQ